MEDKKTKFYETLCNNHNHIMHNLKQIKKLTKDARIRDLINETLEFSRYCKKQGLRMEARAALYRKHIEACGFRRIYTKKHSWNND